MSRLKLQIAQLESKLLPYLAINQSITPSIGWVRTIRLTLGISLVQLANKLSISKQSAQELEAREKEGNITLKSLKEAAKALDMKLVYGFVPIDGSLESLIERKAKELATQIVMRTSNTMKLEDQENSALRLKKAIEQRTQEIKYELPKSLWD